MPGNQVVLVAGVPGVNDLLDSSGAPVELVGVDDLGGPAGGTIALLLVPSLPVVLQTAWLRSVARGRRRTFAAWAGTALASGAGSDPDPAPPWRYDVLVARCCRALGPGRVVVVAGAPPVQEAALVEAVGVTAPDLGLDLSTAPRALTAAEVGLLEELMGQLGEVGLVGPVAVDLVEGVGLHLMRTAAPTGDGAAPAGPEVAALAADLVGRVEALGVRVAGDPGALQWRAAGADPVPPTVPLEAAVEVVRGLVGRTLSWADTGASR